MFEEKKYHTLFVSTSRIVGGIRTSKQEILKYEEGLTSQEADQLKDDIERDYGKMGIDTVVTLG